MNLPSSTHLLLIRHAESLNNRYGASVGSDSGLTAQGWDQARRLAEWLANNEPVDVLVSSSLLRARQTADIIAQKLHLPVYIQPGLHETEHPYWEEFPTLAENWGLPESSWLLTPEIGRAHV